MIVYSPCLSILYSNLNLSMFVYTEEAIFTFIFIIIKTMAVTQEKILKMKEKFNKFLESIDDSNAFYIKSQQYPKWNWRSCLLPIQGHPAIKDDSIVMILL